VTTPCNPSTPKKTTHHPPPNPTPPPPTTHKTPQPPPPPTTTQKHNKPPPKTCIYAFLDFPFFVIPARLCLSTSPLYPSLAPSENLEGNIWGFSTAPPSGQISPGSPPPHSFFCEFCRFFVIFHLTPPRYILGAVSLSPSPLPGISRPITPFLFFGSPSFSSEVQCFTDRHRKSPLLLPSSLDAVVA